MSKILRYLGGLVAMLAGNDGTNTYIVKVDSAGLLSTKLESFVLDTELGKALFPFNDKINEYDNAQHDGVSWNYLDCLTVPAGELWVVQSITGYHTGAAARQCKITRYDGSNRSIIEYNNTLAASTLMKFHGQLVLKESDIIQFCMVSAVAGEWMYLWTQGYKVDIS